MNRHASRIATLVRSALAPCSRRFTVALSFGVLQPISAAEPAASTADDIAARAVAPAWVLDDPADIFDWHMGWAEICESANQWQSAVPHRQVALAVWLEHKGEDNFGATDARILLDNAKFYAERRDELSRPVPPAPTPAWIGDDPAQVLAWHTGWAELGELAHEWIAAESHRAAALAAWVKHRGPNDWHTVDARVALDGVRFLKNLAPERRRYFAEIFEFRRRARRAMEIHDVKGALDAMWRSEFLYRKTLRRPMRVGLAVYRDYAEYAAAADDYRQVAQFRHNMVDISKGLLGEAHPKYLENLRLLANMAGEVNAEDVWREALASVVESGGESSLQMAACLDELAAIQVQKSDLTRAEAMYVQALDIRRRLIGERHADYATSLANLAGVYRRERDYGRAQSLCEQALAVRQGLPGKPTLEHAALLVELSTLYSRQGKYDLALPLYEQAAAIRKERLGADDLVYADTLDRLADLQMSAQQYHAAAKLYREVLDIRRRVYRRQDHAQIIVALLKEALAYVHVGDYSRARRAYDDPMMSLRVHTTLPGRRSIEDAEILKLKAFFNLFTQRDPWLLFEEALNLEAADNEAKRATQTQQQQLAASQNNRFEMDGYLTSLVAHPFRAPSAYKVVLARKGATFMSARAARLAAESDELRPLFERLRLISAKWSAMMRAPARNDQSWQNELDQLAREQRLLETALNDKSAAFRELEGENLFQDLVAALPPRTVLVDFVEFQKCQPPPGRGPLAWQSWLIAFVVRPGEEAQLVDLGERTAIDSAIDQWRSTYGISAEARAAAQLLRERLWAPIEAKLGDAETVLISPDGATGRASFAALPGRAPGTYLLEDYRLALVPVPRLIPSLMKQELQQPANSKALLLGGADYDSRQLLASAAVESTAETEAVDAQPSDAAAGMTWGNLPGAAAEVAAIAKIYEGVADAGGGSVVVLSGDDATEERFRAAAAQCDVLHLSTHGFFAAEDKTSALAVDGQQRSSVGSLFGNRLDQVEGYAPGLLSGVVFGGANHPPVLSADAAANDKLPDDGILTADELQFMPLGGARLVVLSACNTGLGQSAGGEGLLGIQRAFQIAGARSTIATLWKVDDAMTQRLMTAFYTNALVHKQSYLDALRNAQLQILRKLRDGGAAALSAARGGDAPADAPPPSSPYYWAAFTFSGDWR